MFDKPINLKGHFPHSGLDGLGFIPIGIPLPVLIALGGPGLQIVISLDAHGFVHHYSDQLR